MKLLHIGKTTMQTYRNQGHIRYFQADWNLILYDRDSMNERLEKHSKEVF
jgi:hypothetical protein